MRGSSVRRKLRSSAGGEMAQSNIDPPESRDDNPSRLKRKQSSVDEDEEVVIPSKKKKQDLEEGVISVGAKTSRTRLLQLLQNRLVSKKKGRLSSKAPEPTSSTLDIAQDPGEKSAAEDQAVTTNPNENSIQGSFTFLVNTKDKEDIPSSTLDIAQEPGEKSAAEDQAVTINPNEIDFQIYSTTELENMLRDVGVDTFGMDKSKLIKCCKSYEELITRARISRKSCFDIRNGQFKP
ncbi:uncharacterized protein MELLADRAFT_111672 [Melampsora larici-populina 98AG31]|uniref:Uncharacterized protein n=1 Tax=Melampsora larici-populina (strain 98AG31 / pathotype 3-4-7) TaxID=747676 RepID=F4S3Z6_MELLP|nr:uncharacterized protein MELLADRAFT_111672 [Melampsora larici-populina 98AG31]EGG00652.1 hypothetical protein MELLADRAFT_111672 [Melampsora larici-populina 98AG31]